MKKFLLLISVVLALVALTAIAPAQSNLTGRVFTYDATTATNGTANYELDNATVTQSATVNNTITAPGVTGANFGVKTLINVLSYVWISGNFAATYSVRGFGTSSDVQEDNLLEVRTNRALTFTPSGFSKLLDGVADASAMGSITYQMGLYKDYSSTVAGLGALVKQSSAQVDTAFVSSVNSAMTDLPANGKLTLRLSRSLALTQLAQGTHTYSATGVIGLTIN